MSNMWNFFNDQVFLAFCVIIVIYMITSKFIGMMMVVHNRFWRHWNIRKHGYPPEHCDADGDFKPKPEKWNGIR